MALTDEEENFVKITKIIVEIIPKYLRKCFVEKWNRKYPNQPWQSDNASGSFLFSELSKTVQTNKKREKEIEKMKEGNEQTWDTTTVVFALLDAGLNLIQGSRPKDQRSSPFRISEEVEVVRDIRNSFFGHVPNMSCANTDFSDIIVKVKIVAKNIFCQDAVDEVENVEKSHIETKIAIQLQKQLDVEINRNKDFNQLVSEIEELKEGIEEVKEKFEKMEGKVDNVEQKVDNLQENIGRWKANLSSSNLQSYRKKDSDELRRLYIETYSDHEIHIVKNDVIVKALHKVDDFSVKVKVAESATPETSFTNELQRHADSLNFGCSKEVEIGDLVNKDHSVTFIRGVAGIGKSVLSRQIAVGWATEEIYTDIKYCYLIQCSNLKDFYENEGKGGELCEIISRFLKERLRCEVRNEKDVLIIIDGTDELPTWQIRSILSRILRKDGKFCDSNIILTGRPHVQGYVFNDKDSMMRKPRVLEMVGLDKNNIDEYIKKYVACMRKHDGENLMESQNDIIKTIEASSSVEFLHSVPQFLNTLCCVAILTKGKAVWSITELYCWLIYLLFKQHIWDKNEQRSDDYDDEASEIFSKYSDVLQQLGELCYELLRKNEIIFKKCEFQQVFRTADVERSFIKSVLVKLPGNLEPTYTFKHLTLMEFFSSVHCFSNEERNLEEIVTELVQFELFQVLEYYSGLHGSLRNREVNIVNCLSQSIWKSNSVACFTKIVDALIQSSLLKPFKVSNILSCFREYYSGVQTPSPETCLHILDQIKSIGCDYFIPSESCQLNFANFFAKILQRGISDLKLKQVFTEMRVKLYHPNVNASFVPYFKIFPSIILRIKNCSLSLKQLLPRYEYFKHIDDLTFAKCEVGDDGDDDDDSEAVEIRTNEVGLNELVIYHCEFDDNSLKLIGPLFACCKEIYLGALRMSPDGLESISNELQEKLAANSFKLRKIFIIEMELKNLSLADVFTFVECVNLGKIETTKEFMMELSRRIAERAKEGVLKLKELALVGVNIPLTVWQMKTVLKSDVHLVIDEKQQMIDENGEVIEIDEKDTPYVSNDKGNNEPTDDLDKVCQTLPLDEYVIIEDRTFCEYENQK